MKITLFSPGAGEDFYCENCMRDAYILRALAGSGHRASSAPLYLPPLDIQTGRPTRLTEPIFFGGINVYLQQKLGMFRHSPRWLDRLFDAQWLLKLAGRMTGMTDAKLLGEMTLSMLRGRHGRQAKELARLADHLAADPPDVLIFSNALLAGMARCLKRRTGAVALCWLQDEDHFLDSLQPPYREKAWDELRKRCGDIDLLLSPSDYYRRTMAERLDIDPDRIVVVPQGIEFDGFERSDPPADGTAKIPTIGFLSQMSADKGLDLLIEAVALLRGEAGLENLRLIADGGETRADQPFVETLDKRILQLELTGHVEFRHRFDLDSKRRFLDAIDVLCVPTRRPEAYGLYILDALARGKPVVVPDHGGQGELAGATGGGLLFEPNSLDDLQTGLRRILTDPSLAAELAAKGRRTLQDRYRVETMTARLIELASGLTGKAG